MSHYSAARARELLSEVIDQSSRKAVFIERRGSVAAVVISPAQYEAMLDALEERDDILAFDQAILEAVPNVPWDEIKADLGLA
jgi:PHD/YefM family antitoxin component YafN of YafNO toxin-antitoxin module